MKYRHRIADIILDKRLEAFGGALITGPKGCGKTTTAKQKAASFIELQDEDQRENYLAVANSQPSRLLEGAKPRLFDEWQDAPKLWGAIRKSIDDEQKNGLYILTGSTSQTVDTAHTGTLRISTVKMYPMSLYESGESNGEVSIKELFDRPESFKGCSSRLSIDDLIFAACRGGWPQAVINSSSYTKLEVAKELFRQTCAVDMSKIDNTRRNAMWVDAVLRSYARNLCTVAAIKTIYDDVRAATGMSESAFYDYASALEKLYIIEDVDAWCPSIRSKSSIRASKKKNFIDPSIAAAALGVGPEYFDTDFKTLAFLFESLCIRDLRVYSAESGGRVSYYRDRFGLEADAVLHLEDGRYALVEIKLGEGAVEEAARHLNKIESLIKKHNASEKQVPLRLPDLKIVLTGARYGYRRDDDVFVIPIGCLKN